MSRANIRTQKLTVLLLKESVASPEDALRNPNTLQRVPLRNEIPYRGELWYSNPRPREPRWKQFVNPILEAPLSEPLATSTISAVLFVEAEGRFFAFTFGYGRNLLKPDCYERGFGLKVALNRIHHERLRSMDLRTYEDIMVATRKQTSKSAQLAAFGIDVSRDLLRAVTGEPEDSTFAKRLTGTDALTFTAQITAEELNRKCSELLQAYRDDRYRQHFEWVDFLGEVRDPNVVNTLNDKLVQAFKNGDTQKLHLAPPEVIDWQSVEKFRIGGTRQKEYDDLEIDEYLRALGEKKEQLSIEKLRSYQVSVRWTESETFQKKWSLFNCVVWETNFDNRLYALVEGRWFEIERNFAEKVNRFVTSLPTPERQLPPAQENEREQEYNKRVANLYPSYICLDGVLVRSEDMATRIEFCDLLSDQKELIYVKKKTRSATLSHLFSQGTVAAQTFLLDGNFREQIRRELRNIEQEREELIPNRENRPNPAEYTIVYAIITNSTDEDWPGSLPFFSQLNLMQHAKRLDSLGFKVALTKIEESER